MDILRKEIESEIGNPIYRFVFMLSMYVILIVLDGLIYENTIHTKTYW